MPVNRIRPYASQSRIAIAGKAALGVVPQSVAPAIPHGFAVCPPQMATANTVQQQIYRLAYQRAQAAVQVPRHYRLLFSVWN